MGLALVQALSALIVRGLLLFLRFLLTLRRQLLYFCRWLNLRFGLLPRFAAPSILAHFHGLNRNAEVGIELSNLVCAELVVLSILLDDLSVVHEAWVDLGKVVLPQAILDDAVNDEEILGCFDLVVA